MPNQASGGVERLEFELDTGLPGAWGVMNFTGSVRGLYCIAL